MISLHRKPNHCVTLTLTLTSVLVEVVVAVGVGGLVTTSPSTAIAYDAAATAADDKDDEDDDDFEVELDADGVVAIPALIPTSLLSPLLLILLLLLRARRGRSAPTTVLRLLSEVIGIGTCATGASIGGPIAAWDTLMAKLPASASASTPNTIPSFLPFYKSSLML